MKTDRKLKMGMVGGGSGAFIGGIHRMAAQLDGQIELVCGVFSSDADKSIAFGKEIYLNDDRLYRTFDEMMASEARLLRRSEWILFPLLRKTTCILLRRCPL